MFKKTKTASLIFLAVLVGFFGLSNFSNAESDTSEIEVKVMYTLTVHTDHGTVIGTDGFSCQNDTCFKRYDSGSSITLSVVTEDGYTFSGWQGGVCGGTDPCSLTMNSSKEITAKYTKETEYFNLIVNVGTGGKVTGLGVNCSPTGCQKSFEKGEEVELKAEPNDGFSFASWSGCNSSNGNKCNITMSSNKNVTATFSINQYNLAVTKNGNGTINFSPLGVSCGTLCQKYDYGTPVSLTATADTGYSFSGWSGECSGAGSCSFTMNSNKNVTATFSKENETTGTVSSPYCYVHAGESSCCTSVTWNVYFPKAGTQPELRTNPSGSPIATGDNGSIQRCFDINDPREYYYLYNNGTQLAYDFSQANCIEGAYQSGNECVENTETHNVIFNKNGGTGSMSSQIFEEGQTKKLTKNTFTRTNYIFKKWNTQANGNGNSYADQANFTMGSFDVTLYAIWEENMKGTISATNCSIPIGQNKCNTTISWNVTNPVSTTKVTTPENITVGSGHNGTTSYSLNYGESRNFFLYNNGIEIKEAQASATCKSGGIWNEAQNKCIEDKTCFGCLVTTSSESCYISPESLCVTSLIGGKQNFIITPANLESPNTQEDYDISAEGCGKGGITGNTYTTGTLNKNSPNCLITADCLIKKQKITFRSNGGTGTMDPQFVERNSSASLNKNLFQKQGSAFKEWNTKEDGTGKHYADQENFSMGKTDVVLYAQWSELGKSLKVTIEGDGSVTSNPTGIVCPTDCEEGYNHNEKIILTATPYTDNSFFGWEGCDKVLENNQCEVTLNTDKIIKAKFVSAVITPNPLEHNINPNTNIPFSYSVSAGLSPAECRLLDFEKNLENPLTQYEDQKKANLIEYPSESTSGKYAYFIQCRNKNNPSIVVTSPKILVNVVVVSVIPTLIGTGEPGSVYSFEFTPDSSPKEPESLYRASCRLLGSDNEELTGSDWTPVNLGYKNYILYTLPNKTGDFGYHIRCRNDEYLPAQVTSAKIIIQSVCSEGHELDDNGNCSSPLFSVSDGCVIPSGDSKCSVDVDWNIHQGGGVWAITSNTPKRGSIVVDITNSNRRSGTTKYDIYLPEPVHHFFLYNDGEEIKSITSGVSCQIGTLWDSGKGFCDIPPKTINVHICDIPEDENTCKDDINWKFEDGIYGLEEGDICVQFNEKVKCTHEGEMKEELFYYGENSLVVLINGNSIKESSYTTNCVSGTEWDSTQEKCIIKKPEIDYFKAEPAAIFSGQSSLLKWKFNKDLVEYCEIIGKLLIDDTEGTLMLKIDERNEDQGSLSVHPGGTTKYYMTCYKDEKKGETLETMVSVIDLFIKER